MPRRFSAYLVALVSSLAIVAVAVAAESPFSALSTRSDSQKVSNPGERVNLKVGCAGKSAVSGGFSTGKVSALQGPLIDGSRAKGGRWQTTGSEFIQGEGSDRVTGDANCASRAPKIHVDSSSSQVKPGKAKSVVAKCGSGGRAVAGGFKTTYDGGGPTGVIVSSSYRSGGAAWKVRGVGVNQGGPTKLTAYAYCADVPKLAVVSKGDSGKPGQVHANPKCPRGKTAISGGFRSALGSNGTFLSSNIPETSGLKNARTWKTQAFHPPFSPNKLPWKGYVYCAE